MSSLLPPKLLEKPDFYPLVIQNDTLEFAKMTRNSYLQSIFTDPYRIHAASTTITKLDIEMLVAAHEAQGSRPARINFIFHCALCGSTLLSRALDLPGRTLACREPYPLRQLGVEAAAVNSQSKNNKAWNDKLELMLALLSRRFSEVEVPVVKANIPVNFMLPELLQLLPDYKAVFLYSSLEDFLVASLKVPQRRQWVDDIIKQTKGGIRSIEGLSSFPEANLSVAQRAATLWVAQMVKFHQVLTSFGGVSSLESNQLFEQPEPALLAVAKLFDIDITADQISVIASGNVFSRYSKDPKLKFNAEMRGAFRAQVRAKIGPEIDEGLQWGKELMAQCGISEEMPNGLL